MPEGPGVKRRGGSFVAARSNLATSGRTSFLGAAFRARQALPSLEVGLAQAEATLLDNQEPAKVYAEALQMAFRRFQMPHSKEMSKDDLVELVQYLGLLLISEEEVLHIATKVTPYNEMDYTEFLSFIDLFFQQEREKLLSMFAKFDLDRRNEITVESVRKLMSCMGLMPLRAMTEQALLTMGMGTDSLLDFEAFVCFFTLYRHSEGFTQEEVAKLYRVFDRFARASDLTAAAADEGEELRLPAAQMDKALIHMFGLQAAAEAQRLGAWAARLARRRNGNEGVPEVIEFREFLIFARRMREAEYHLLRKEYAHFSTSSNGDALITVEELYTALRNLGYEPLRKVIAEVLAEVKSERSEGLSLEEFIHFVLVFQARDGFTQKEIVDMHKAYKTFDADNSDSIDVTELSNMLRHMGYYMCLNELHLLVREVDVNHSGELDLPEFLRLMRYHREFEIKRFRRVFNKYQFKRGAIKAVIAAEDVPAALQEVMPSAQTRKMSNEYSKISTRGVQMGEPPPLSVGFSSNDVDFEAFMDLAESRRDQLLVWQQRFAGFPNNKIQEFQEMFDMLREDNTGIVTSRPLHVLLEQLGLNCRTVEEQREVLRALGQAHQMAVEAGVEPLSRPGEGSVCFWVLVQLMRILNNEREQAMEACEAQVVKELGFTNLEVNEFREIYLRWSRRSRAADQEHAGGGSGAGELEEGGVRRLGFVTSSRPEAGVGRLVLHQLLLSLGLKPSPNDMEEMKAKFSQCDLDEHGCLTFCGFLAMMRWILDSDFAGVNGKAAQAIDLGPSQVKHLKMAKLSLRG